MWGPGPTGKDIEKSASDVYRHKKDVEKINNVNPFSEHTLRLKRNLLTMSVFGILLGIVGIDGGRISVFGLSSQYIGKDAVFLIIASIIIYMMISFIWWSIDEIRDWRLGHIKALLDQQNESYKKIKETFSGWNDNWVKMGYQPLDNVLLKASNDALLAMEHEIRKERDKVKMLGLSAKLRIYYEIILPITMALTYLFIFRRDILNGAAGWALTSG